MYQNFNSPSGSRMRAVGSERPVDGFAHIFSDGTNVSCLFGSREDFIYGMNAMAVTAYCCGLSILTMQLMETHFHLIAKGRPKDCDEFARRIAVKLLGFLTQAGRRFVVKGRLEVRSDMISSEEELKSKFAYVYRNAISAGFPLMPWMYEWGPGDIYFADHESLGRQGRRIDSLRVKDRREMLRTKAEVPGEWRFNDEGMLLPHSYMDWRTTESLFRYQRVLMAFMCQRKDIEAAIDRECSSFAALHRLSETELRREGNALCNEVWGVPSLAKASMEQRLAVAQKLWGDRRTYSLSVLSRVTMVDKGVLEGIFGK
jgi:hypothetical protein